MGGRRGSNCQESILQEARLRLHRWRASFHPQPLQFEQEEDVFLLVGGMAQGKQYLLSSLVERIYSPECSLRCRADWRLLGSLPGSRLPDEPNDRKSVPGQQGDPHCSWHRPSGANSQGHSRLYSRWLPRVSADSINPDLMARRTDPRGSQPHRQLSFDLPLHPRLLADGRAEPAVGQWNHEFPERHHKLRGPRVQLCGSPEREYFAKPSQ